MSLLVPTMFALTFLKNVDTSLLTEVNLDTLNMTVDVLIRRRNMLEEYIHVIRNITSVYDTWHFNNVAELTSCLEQYHKSTGISVKRFLEVFNNYIRDKKEKMVTEVDAEFVLRFKKDMKFAKGAMPMIVDTLGRIKHDIIVLEDITAMIFSKVSREHFIESLKEHDIDISSMVDP